MGVWVFPVVGAFSFNLGKGSTAPKRLKARKGRQRQPKRLPIHQEVQAFYNRSRKHGLGCSFWVLCFCFFGFVSVVVFEVW